MNIPKPLGATIPAVLSTTLSTMALVPHEFTFLGMPVPDMVGPLGVFEENCNLYTRAGWLPVGGPSFGVLPGKPGLYVFQSFIRPLNATLP